MEPGPGGAVPLTRLTSGVYLLGITTFPVVM